MCPGGSWYLSTRCNHLPYLFFKELAYLETITIFAKQQAENHEMTIKNGNQNISLDEFSLPRTPKLWNVYFHVNATLSFYFSNWSIQHDIWKIKSIQENRWNYLIRAFHSENTNSSMSHLYQNVWINMKCINK